jgi:hypothetical protein
VIAVAFFGPFYRRFYGVNEDDFVLMSLLSSAFPPGSLAFPDDAPDALVAHTTALRHMNMMQRSF